MHILIKIYCRYLSVNNKLTMVYQTVTRAVADKGADTAQIRIALMMFGNQNSSKLKQNSPWCTRQ